MGAQHPEYYLQYIGSQVSTSWGQESGSADVCIYTQWNPGKCTNIACSTVPAVRHWPDLWYLWRQPHRKWEGLSNVGESPTPWIGASFNWKLLNVTTGDLFSFWHRGKRFWIREIRWRRKKLYRKIRRLSPLRGRVYISQFHTQLPAQGFIQNRHQQVLNNGLNNLPFLSLHSIFALCWSTSETLLVPAHSCLHTWSPVFLLILLCLGCHASYFSI